MKRIAALALAIAVTGCGVPSTNAGDLHGFTSEKERDLFGYYIPAHEIRLGKFVLDNFSIGQPSDFRDFEVGKLKDKPYAPVMFEFSDTTSPKKQGELGEYYANAPRVLPDAYRLIGNSVTFIGTDRQLGTVVFSGTLDPGAIKAAQASSGGEKAVLRGDLSVGTKTIKNVTFTWFGGD
jgi:hypothetical protein